MDFRPPFGRWLKQQRKALGLTQAELARRVNYAVVTLRKVEAGAHSPSQDMAEALAAALQVPAADLGAFIAFARGLEPRRYTDLPAPDTPLVGREDDLAALEALLGSGETRLLTLVGPPGVGKTRLAIALAARAEPALAHGTVFVALAALNQASQVAPAIARALDLRAPPHMPMVDALGRLMRDKRLLLVLDNFEHLLEAAPAASRLLAAAPGLRILATSRAPLRLTGERVYDLPPLRVPDLRRLPPVADLRRYSAIDLFVRRARDAKSAFALTPANAPAVAEICQRLDGLPLAIELAAVRVRAFTPQTMLTHLDHHTGASLRFLTAAPRNLPPHQKTLRRAIDWSCQLLAPGDQRLLRRLGVFVGGWTLLAAQTVCGQGTEGESSDAQTARSAVADSLARLVEHNLAQEAEGPQGESRYSLLETIREYALEQLEAAGEAQDLRARFVRHYAHMAQAVEPLLTEHRSINPLNLPAYRQLKPDYANLLQALAWCEPAFPEPLARLRFLLSLAWFWIIQAHLTGQPGDLESLERRIIETRERCAAIPDDLLAVVLHRLSWLAGAQGDLPRAIERGAAFLAHSRAHGTTAQVMHALYAHGVSLCLAGRLDDGQPSLEEQERLAREADSPYDLAAAVGMLGRIALGRGDPARAEVLLAEALDVARRHGYDWTPSASGSVCASQRDLGLARIRRDDIAGGMAVLEEARDFALRNQLTLFTASCEVYLAYGDLRLGRAASACQRLRFSLHLFQQANYEDRACGVLALHAQALSRLGRLDSAMTIAGAAASKEAVIQNASPSEMLLREDCLRALDEARGHLGDPRLASAWAAGMAMTLDQAVALAQSDA